MKPYKGYRAAVTFHEDDLTFHGEIVGLRDVIHFEAAAAADLIQAFHDSVDDYLAFCAEDGVDPQKPFAGALSLRATPELHRRMIETAAIQGKSLNQWMVDALSKQADADYEAPTKVG